MVTFARVTDVLEQASDEFIADRAADGDVRAFTMLVRRYRRLMRAYAARILGSAADSDDVAQDALVTAWAQLPTLQDHTKVRSWLVQITTRKALDLLRARQQHVDITELALPDPREGPGELADLGDVRTALARALGALPVQQRQVWLLRELGGHSYDEIAAELALPPSTVRGLLARARQALIRDMDEWR